MPYLSVGQENSGHIDLYYEDHGSGRPVVLIHGFPLSSRSWEKQVPLLLESGHRVIAYDRRGFGNSGKPSFGYDYDTFAADMNALIEALDLKDATLIGFSMGGGEVARYLGKYGTKRVRDAVFISSIPPYLGNAADNPEGVDRAVFSGVEQGIAADRLSFLTEFFKNFYNVDQLYPARINDQALQFSWNIASLASPIATYQCVSTWQTDFRKDLERIDVPTLVIHGDSDRIVPIEAAGARTAKAVKGAKLVTVSGGPHAVNWTHAEEVNAALGEFLQIEAGKSKKSAA